MRWVSNWWNRDFLVELWLYSDIQLLSRRVIFSSGYVNRQVSNAKVVIPLMELGFPCEYMVTLQFPISNFLSLGSDVNVIMVVWTFLVQQF